MIFNNIDINVTKQEANKYKEPKLVAGSKIILLFDDTDYFPGCRKMKKGKYIIKKVSDGILSKVPYKNYEISCDRKNSTYEWHVHTEAIDKAIDLGLINLTSYLFF